ncbi:hypothetical protein ACHAXS_009540 [Conticribra weissflogii]
MSGQHQQQQQQQQQQSQQQSQQQQQYNRGILPSETLNALDYLVDRLNASSGYLTSAATSSSPRALSTSASTPSDAKGANPSSSASDPNPPPSGVDGGGPNGTAPTVDNGSDGNANQNTADAKSKNSKGDNDANNNNNNNNDDNDNIKPPPILALLVGTNEGVGLSRSLGTAHTARAATDPANFSFSGTMNEEVLSSVETVWATLVSAAPPHVMAAAARAGAGQEGGDSAQPPMPSQRTDVAPSNDDAPPHVQPPHPLLAPLRLGSCIRTVTASYENCTLVHVHMSPLVVTLVTTPEANVGAIKSMALPILKVLLEPVRRCLVRSRGGGDAAGVGMGGNAGSGHVSGGEDGLSGGVVGGGAMRGAGNGSLAGEMAVGNEGVTSTMGDMGVGGDANHAVMMMMMNGGNHVGMGNAVNPHGHLNNAPMGMQFQQQGMTMQQQQQIMGQMYQNNGMMYQGNGDSNMPYQYGGGGMQQGNLYQEQQMMNAQMHNMMHQQQYQQQQQGYHGNQQMIQGYHGQLQGYAAGGY